MSDVDYEELFQSPLDDPETGPGWGPGIAGLGVGIALALLASLAFGGGSEPPAAVADSTSPPTATSTPIAANFPTGYVEIVDGLAARPSELIRDEDTITLAFTTAVERGSDPLTPIYPVGGTWWLESIDGDGVESSRHILGRYSPAAFSVEFPAASLADEAGFRRVVMIDRRELREVSGSSRLPFSEEPFAMAEPLTIPIDQGITLIVKRLELGRFLGRVDWVIEGPEDPKARVLVAATLLDADGSDVGTYAAFPELLDPASAGTTEITWGEPFPTTQDGAVTVVVEYTVGLVQTVPTDVVFDLTDVDVGR